MSAGHARRGAGSAWSEMIKDEQMDDISNSLFSSATVYKDRGLQSRGTEQYLTRRVGAGSRKRKREDDETDGSNEGEKKTENQQTVKEYEKWKPPKPYESDSELSSGGLSDNSKDHVRTNMKKRKLLRKQYKERAMKEYLKKVACKPDEDDSGEDEPKRKMCKMEIDTDDTPTDKNPDLNVENQAAVAPQPQVKQWKLNHLNQLEKKSDEAVAAYIVRNFGESRKYLIENAMSVFGRDECIRVFLKVKKIHFYGGMMIKRQNRQRTQGGIFMYLIKNDTRIPEEKKKQLEEANLRCDEEEKAKKMKSNEKKDNMDAMKNTIMNRLNPSRKPENNCILDLDGNKEYSVRAPPAPIPAGEGANVPSRAVVSYDDLDPFN